MLPKVMKSNKNSEKSDLQQLKIKSANSGRLDDRTKAVGPKWRRSKIRRGEPKVLMPKAKRVRPVHKKPCKGVDKPI